ncbi:hypothetical protein CERSUDRAFT_77079 [Gelatoporia subvermispora B]|uniref:SET domain-containing protein n=1 Tax=Ceriporiopsis subvermispora (strain B) TaxID=914234 RepID=M2R1C4_CERS8|nr:hypothetical protein CERSUDRAFT_77079 [Gelatoporia subvermispora B]
MSRLPPASPPSQSTEQSSCTGCSRKRAECTAKFKSEACQRRHWKVHKAVCKPPHPDSWHDSLSSLGHPAAHIELIKAFRGTSAVQPTGLRFLTLPLPPRDPQGTTECIFTDGMKKAILAQPGFPVRVLRPRIPACRIALAPGAGLGMFATRPLRMLELIHAERPLLLAPVPEGEPDAVTTGEYEEWLAKALDRMLPYQADAYRALANAKGDAAPPLTGILQTNGWSTRAELYEIAEHLPLDVAAVGTVASRVNHSCAPNATLLFRTGSLSMPLIATRAIAAGEQITVSYIDIFVPAVQRQQQLAKYSFPCACVACMDSAASDARRAWIQRERRFTDKALFERWTTDLSLPDRHLIDPLCDLLQLIADEGAFGFELVSHILSRLARVWSALGHEQLTIMSTALYLDVLSAQWGEQETQLERLVIEVVWIACYWKRRIRQQLSELRRKPSSPEE